LTDLSYEAVFGKPEEEQPQPGQLLTATVGNYNSSTGTTLIFPGQTEASQKRYKRLSGASISNGSKVLVAKVSGTYVILGAIV
jgi:hypothetical protein